MPKNVLIIVIVAVILVIGGGAFWYVQSQQSESKQSVATSIKDALSQSVSLECSYTDGEGRESKTYIKNGAVRSDYIGQTPEETGSVIVQGNMMYVWNAQKQGFKMEIPEVTGTQQQTDPVAAGVTQKEDLLAELEKYKDACKPAVVSDSLFTPPSDVVFTDYSQMMQDLPAEAGYPSVDPAQAEKMMQQYESGAN